MIFECVFEKHHKIDWNDVIILQPEPYTRHRKDKVLAHMNFSKLTKFRDLLDKHLDWDKKILMQSELKPRLFVASLLDKFYLLCMNCEVDSFAEEFKLSGM